MMKALLNIIAYYPKHFVQGALQVRNSRCLIVGLDDNCPARQLGASLYQHLRHMARG